MKIYFEREKVTTTARHMDLYHMQHSHKLQNVIQSPYGLSIWAHMGYATLLLDRH